MMYDTLVLAANEISGNAAGAAKLMIFFLALILLFWGLNAYKHFKSGWTKTQRVCDISGLIFLAAVIAIMVMPLL